MDITTDKKYLSEVYSELPTNVLLNKGVTGCGGTYVELHSPRNSLILVPMVELAKNKQIENSLIVYGDIKNNKIVEYINSEIFPKKIIGTYDSLKRLLEVFPDITDYFLLIDEYHILFNAYSFRNEAIVFLLKNYKNFKKFCFMTATPLDEDVILEEIKDLPRINITWTKAIPIKLSIIDTSFTSKELLNNIRKEDDVNYHIFLNSVRTIKEVIKKSNITDYKVVCSETSKKKNKSLKLGTTLDDVKKYNFYTASAFEGCDIFDPKGKSIILCDTTIATTILDISTLIRQICGRLRDSVYKEDITIILNTSKHRYAGISKEMFNLKVEEGIKIGKYTEYKFNTDSDPLYKEKELKSYSSEVYNSFYVNKFKNNIFFDDNLRKMDVYNYKLITQIYNNSISVIKEINSNNMEVVKFKKSNWILDQLENREYTFSELEDIFKPQFEERGLIFNGFTIKDYFPQFEKTRKTKNKIKETYYKFNYEI